MSKLPPLLVFPDKYDLAWHGDMHPDHGPYRTDKEKQCPPRDLVDAKEALTRDWPTDAHCAMYAVEGEDCAPRIAKKAVRDGVIEPVLRWIIVDIDTPDHIPVADADEWLEGQLDLTLSIPECTHALIWKSRGGIKIAWPLADDRQYGVKKGEDYLQMFHKYLVGEGLDVDEACKDWTRLMRLPRTVRDGTLQDYQVYGWDNLKPLGWEPPRAPRTKKAQKKNTVRVRAKRSGGGDYYGRDAEIEAPDLGALKPVVFSIPADNYEVWFEVGTILKNEYGEDGWLVFLEWSAKGDSFDSEDACRSKWEQLPSGEIDGGLSVGTIFHYAKEANQTTTRVAEEVLEDCATIEDYYTPEALLSGAHLRRENGPEWQHVINALKRKYRVGSAPKFKDWESAVCDKQKQIRHIRSLAGAAFRAAEREARKASGGLVTNFELDTIMADGNEKLIKTHKPIGEIKDDIFEATGDWPRSFAGRLFVPGRDHGSIDGDQPVRFIETASDLGAYLQSVADVSWTDQAVLKDETKARSVNYGEMLSDLEADPAEYYQQIEVIPHEPPLEGVYYTTEIGVGDGSTLEEFISYFSPATDLDRDLIEAAILTMYWGGPLGSKPAFTITSEFGTGAGKSAFVDALDQVYGGMIDISADDDGIDWQETMQRVLTDNALQCRIVRVDNLKGRMDVSALESAITSRYLSGKKMYHGEMKVPNVYSWFVTVNTPEYSTDLAERSVVIELAKPDYDFPFDEKVREMMRTRRRALLEDIHARLLEPRNDVEETTRFSVWERQILGLFDDPDALVTLIKKRRGEVDAEADEAKEMLHVIESLVGGKFDNPATTRVLIPRGVVCEALAKEWGVKRVSGRELSSRLKPLLDKNETLKACVKWTNNRSFGYRAIEWVGDHCRADQEIEEWPKGRKSSKGNNLSPIK